MIWGIFWRPPNLNLAIITIQAIYLHVSAEVSVMAMLRYVKRDVHPSGRTCVLSQGNIEAAQKSISKAIDVASDKSHQCGKYTILILRSNGQE